MNARLICLRHAESEPRIPDFSSGTADRSALADPPLTQRGCSQAEAVGHHLAAEKPEWLFVSDALRSRQTGEIIASFLGARIEVVPALAEVSMGRGDREPDQSGVRADILRQWLVSGNLNVRLADGETGHQVALRMTHAFHKIAERCDNSTGIVIGHVASLTVGASALCDNGPELWGTPLPYARPFLLTVSDDSWRVQWPGAFF